MTTRFNLIAILWTLSLVAYVDSLAVRYTQSRSAATQSWWPCEQCMAPPQFDRRSAVAALIFMPTFAARADTGAEVRGTQLNAFNGLIFNYRGNDFNGLEAKDLDEPSISYKDFVVKLKEGGVSFVEFYAPDGDVAYATLKEDGRSIRIGEGYPTEQHDGYSSPAFAIRTVKNAGVPYKFVVPALKKS